MEDIKYKSIKVYCRRWLNCFQKKEFQLYYEPFCNNTYPNEKQKYDITLQIAKKFFIDPMQRVGFRTRHFMPVLKTSRIILDYCLGQELTFRDFVKFNINQIMNNYALIVESPTDNFSFDKIHSDWVHLFREKYGLIDFGTYENFCDLVDDVLDYKCNTNTKDN